MANVFSHAGVSRKAGKLKVRWANGIERVKMLIKDGQTDIDLIELMQPMSKEDAVLALLNMNFAAGNAEVQSTLEAEATKRGLPGYEEVKQVKAEEVEADTPQEQAVAEIIEELEAVVADTDNVIVLDEIAPAALKFPKSKKRPAATAFDNWAEAAAAEEEAEAAAAEEEVA